MSRRLLVFALALGVLVPAAFAADPAVKHERIEWADLWIPDNDKTDLPRVLLVGDSICRAYNNDVAKRLEGKAVVVRLATSYSLADPMLYDQLRSLLENYSFAVVHFNNGLHGFDYTEDEYRSQFPNLVKLFRQKAAGAKLIWATSTPMRQHGDNLKQFHGNNERVKVRNQIVLELAAAEKIPVNDLYSLVEDHAEYWSPDGVHFNAEGQAVEAEQVAKSILDALAK